MGHCITPPKQIVPMAPNSVPAPLLSSPFPLRPNPNRFPLQLFPQSLAPHVSPRIGLLPNAQVRLAQRLGAPLPLLAPPPFFGPPVSAAAARLPSPEVFAKLPRPMQVQLLMQANMQLQMAHRTQTLGIGTRPMGVPVRVPPMQHQSMLFHAMPLAGQQRLVMSPSMLPLPPVPLLSNAPIIALQQRTGHRSESLTLSPRYAKHLQQQQQLQQQQLQQRTPFSEQREFYYMTKTERDWVIRVQLLQLHMKDPFVEDYYYLHWAKAQQTQALDDSFCLKASSSEAAAASAEVADAGTGAAKSTAKAASKIYGPKIDYDRRAQALLKDMTFYERKYEPKLTAGTLGRVCCLHATNILHLSVRQYFSTYCTSNTVLFFIYLYLPPRVGDRL